MKLLYFAQRNAREMLRDRLTLFFGLAFPLTLLLLLSAIQAHIPVDLFRLPSLTPGIVIFGYSFLALFSGMLIARDRSGAFMLRLFTSPMRAADFILGYLLPMLPLALGQAVVCYAGAMLLGMPWTPRIPGAILASLPVALVFIGLGLLSGSLLTDKQVGSICGALLTNLCAWLSGAWFDLDLVGGVFRKIAALLPFWHGVQAGRAALSGSGFPGADLLWCAGWALGSLVLAVWAFTRRMRKL